MNSNADDLALLGGLLRSAAIRPVIDRNYPLGQVADAVRRVEAGHARGKVVVSTR